MLKNHLLTHLQTLELAIWMHLQLACWILKIVGQVIRLLRESKKDMAMDKDHVITYSLLSFIDHIIIESFNTLGMAFVVYTCK